MEMNPEMKVMLHGPWAEPERVSPALWSCLVMAHVHWLGETCLAPTFLSPCLYQPAPVPLGTEMGTGVKEEDKGRGTQDGEGCQEAPSKLHPPRQSPTPSSAGVKESVHNACAGWEWLWAHSRHPEFRIRGLEPRGLG